MIGSLSLIDHSAEHLQDWAVFRSKAGLKRSFRGLVDGTLEALAFSWAEARKLVELITQSRVVSGIIMMAVQAMSVRGLSQSGVIADVSFHVIFVLPLTSKLGRVSAAHSRLDS